MKNIYIETIHKKKISKYYTMEQGYIVVCKNCEIMLSYKNNNKRKSIREAKLYYKKHQILCENLKKEHEKW